MHIGFTGTQEGMTENQQYTVYELLVELKPAWVHHGDCIGADDDFANLAYEAGIENIIGHPCNIHHKRAFNQCTVYSFAPLDPLDRNVAIVKFSDIMIATPKSPIEAQRSGTWYTVRRARKFKKPLLLVMPNGSVVRERWDDEAVVNLG